MGFRVRKSGGFDKTVKSLNNALKNTSTLAIMNRYGKRGCELLAEATPKRTGRTAASWDYKVEHSGGRYTIVFTNTNENKGVNIAVILQYGHGTRNGGYVQGIDYINPAAAKVFKEMCDDLWKEVTAA